MSNEIVLTKASNKSRYINELREPKNHKPTPHEHVHTHHRNKRVVEHETKNLCRDSDKYEGNDKRCIFFHKKRKSHSPKRMGEIGLLTASSARTILTRASTSSLTSTLFHNRMGEEINYLLAYTYT